MDKIEVAKIRRPQGVKGELRLEVLLDDPVAFSRIESVYVEGEQAARRIERCFRVSDGFAAKLEGIDRSAAEALRGKSLFILRADADRLKSSTDYFIADLIGKKAVTDAGETLGVIDDVENFGASDIVFIKSEKYKNLCFANIGGIIDSVSDEQVVLRAAELEKVWVFDEQ